MKDFITKNKYGKFILYTGVIIFWIAVWQAASLIVNSELFLPSPLSVLKALRLLIVESTFWQAVGASLIGIISGCLAGIVIGTLLSIITSRFYIANALASPIISIIRATPVASFIILVYVAIRRMNFEVNSVSVVIVILMVLPIIWSNLSQGFKSMDKNLAEVGDIYDFSFAKKCKYLYIPQIKPFFTSACANALGLAWKAGIAAEVICAPKGTIGKNLLETKSNLEMDSLFAWTLVIVLLSMLLENLFKYFVVKERKTRDKT